MKQLVEEKLIQNVEGAAKQASGFFQSRYGLWAIGGISFIESAILLPIMTDPFLVAYIMANKSKALIGTIVTTIASVIGGICAYFMALGFFDFFAKTFLHGTALQEFNGAVSGIDDGTFILTLIGAFTPLPYTLVGLAAGFVGANLWVFILASVIGRGFRYAIVGWGTYKFGEKALIVARERIMTFTILGSIAVVAYIFLHLA